MGSIKNQRGYSVVEIIFAALIGGIVILFLSSQASLIASKGKELNLVASSTDRGSMGVRFSLMVEFAEASYYFSHLPIPIACASEKSPCLRIIDPVENKFVSADGAFKNKTGESFVEFYRDDRGQVKNDHKLFTASGVDILYSSTPSLDLSEQKKEVFVTWPLVDETSPPFPILHRLGVSMYFGLDGALATSAPTGEYVLLTAYGMESSAVDLSEQVQGRLVVLYNNADVKQFSVMRIVDVRKCVPNDSFCKGIVPATYTVKDGHYAVKLMAVSDVDLRGFVPTAAEIGSVDAGNWRGASVNSYFFPTGFSTLFKLNDGDLSGDLDIRKWAHFYHANNLRGEMLVMPVELTSYRLVKGGISKGSYKLMQRSFGKGTQDGQVEIDDVTGPIFIARKLGTKTISVYIGEGL